MAYNLSKLFSTHMHQFLSIINTEKILINLSRICTLSTISPPKSQSLFSQYKQPEVQEVSASTVSRHNIDTMSMEIASTLYSRRSRIFLKRGPLSCQVQVPSRRDSVGGGGGGSSRKFPWSPKAGVIQWGGGSSRIFRRGGPGSPKGR